MRVFEIVASELYGIDVKGTAKPSARFTMTDIPACMWPTTTIIASPAGSTGM